MRSREVDDPTRTRPGARVGADAVVSRSLVAVWQGGTQNFALPVRGRVIIGRGEECDIRLRHASVSRRHVALEVGETAIVVEDLASANGTLLAGRRLEPQERAVVTRGALLEVGLMTLFVQHAEGAPVPSGSFDNATTAPESTMARIEQLIAAVAKSRISVLLLGETGVGKEVMAERLHALSPRAAKPLLRLNCAAMPEALLESELFGHERGAFTGASQTRLGLLAAADGGTVLLDEVGELPMPTQAKLLRVLETREVTSLGASKPRPLDVRFVSATNRDLDALVASGAFRADLLYRLNAIVVAIPPLRDRRNEIPALARTLLAKACVEDGHGPPPITDQAMAALARAQWPGNVRELRNVIERALALCRGRPIEVAHLPPSVASPVEANAVRDERDLASDVEALERRRITDALARAAGNQSRAAELLGISRRTLVSRLDAYRLPRPRKKS